MGTSKRESSSQDKYNLDDAAREMDAGLRAYKETTGKYPKGDDLDAMEEIVLERNKNF